MRAPILVLIIVVAAATGCAKKPILEIDNPWSGHHIAVTSIRPGLVDSIFREGLVIEFDVTPPSGDGPTLKKDFVTVWQALEPQADASGFDAVMMTAPNAATSYAKAIFVKKSGAWLIFDRGEWIPPSAIKPMLRDFGPVATYSLRSTKRPLLGLNATAFVPYRADHGPAGRSDAEIVVSTFPYPLEGRSVWLIRGTCEAPTDRGTRLTRSLSKYAVETDLHLKWPRLESAGYAAAVRDRTGSVDWCGALSKSNAAISHVLP